MKVEGLSRTVGKIKASEAYKSLSFLSKFMFATGTTLYLLSFVAKMFGKELKAKKAFNDVTGRND